MPAPSEHAPGNATCDLPRDKTFTAHITNLADNLHIMRALGKQHKGLMRAMGRILHPYS